MAILAIAFVGISIVFLAVGLITAFRLKDAKGSLRLAKTSIVMAAFSATAAFLIDTLQQLIFEPSPWENPSWAMVRLLYVPLNFFAVLVLAFVASFAVYATYSGGGRKLIVSLIFVVALIPTAYLAFNYPYAKLEPVLPDDPETYNLTPPDLTHPLFALCLIPLGVIPLVAFGRSFIIAKKMGDKLLSHRAGIMFSAILLNEVEYMVFGFTTGSVELVAILTWIPVAFFLLFAVLRITSPLEPKG